jgi:hypothetical protein
MEDSLVIRHELRAVLAFGRKVRFNYVRVVPALSTAPRQRGNRMRRRDFIAGSAASASMSLAYPVHAQTDAGPPGIKSVATVYSTEKPGALPTGVTLQAIDGETMLTTTTMSHNYFARNGLTYATNTTYNAGKPVWCAGYSWDDQLMFGIGCYYAFYDRYCARDLSMGINASIAVTGNVNVAKVTSYGYWCCPCADSTTTIEVRTGTHVYGIHVDELDPTSYITTMPNAIQDGRVWDVTATHNQIVHGDIGDVAMSTVLAQNQYTTPNGSKRSVDVISVDIYWFGGDVPLQWVGGNIFAIPMAFNSPSATRDQMARGSNYGNMIDVQRAWGNGTLTGVSPGSDAYGKSGAASRIPIWALIENGTAFGNGFRNPLGYEVVWAMWSSIIHGARGLDFFSTWWNAPGVQAEVTAANQQIIQLAPAINSPFARGYLISVTPHGYIFPVYEQNWLNGGTECCVHWFNGSFYIFATTRNSKSVTNTSATFTINPNAAVNQITVIGENRTIPVIDHQFTDTFANAWTVHIYQIS